MIKEYKTSVVITLEKMNQPPYKNSSAQYKVSDTSMLVFRIRFDKNLLLAQQFTPELLCTFLGCICFDILATIAFAFEAQNAIAVIRRCWSSIEFSAFWDPNANATTTKCLSKCNLSLFPSH